MRAAYETHNGHGFEVLSISVGERDAEVEGFIDKHDLTYQFLMDRTGEISNAYEITTTPTTYFIAPDGTVVDTVAGVVTEAWLERNLDDYIAT